MYGRDATPAGRFAKGVRRGRPHVLSGHGDGSSCCRTRSQKIRAAGLVSSARHAHTRRPRSSGTMRRTRRPSLLRAIDCGSTATPSPCSARSARAGGLLASKAMRGGQPCGCAGAVQRSAQAGAWRQRDQGLVAQQRQRQGLASRQGVVKRDRRLDGLLGDHRDVATSSTRCSGRASPRSGRPTNGSATTRRGPSTNWTASTTSCGTTPTISFASCSTWVRDKTATRFSSGGLIA